MNQDSRSVFVRYRDAWSDSIRSAVDPGQEGNVRIELLDGEPTGLPEADEDLCWLELEVAGRVSGRQALAMARRFVREWARLLDPSGTVTGPDEEPVIQDPLEVLARRVEPVVSRQSELDITFAPLGSSRPEWPRPVSFAWRVESEAAESITLVLYLDEALASALNSAHAPLETGDVADISVHLLRDVGIPATMRLGEAAITVSDVISFGGGRAQGVDPPYGKVAELAVGGQVMARGEIVLVGGNYGLRITDLPGEQARMAMLRDGDLTG